MGSTINYVPKAPQFGEATLQAQIGVGSFGMKRVGVGGGAELSDRVAVRLDAAHFDQDGNVERADERRDVLAASALVEPTDAWTLKLSADSARTEDAPYWGTPLINGRASNSQRRNNYNFANGFIEHEDLWLRVRSEWQASPGIVVRNEVYWLDVLREWQNLEEYAFNPASNQIDRAFYLGIIHDQQQIGTRADILIESQLAGTMSNRISLGGEANLIDLRYLNNFSTGGFGVSDSVPVDAFVPGLLPTNIDAILDYTTNTRQLALFVDDHLQVTEQLSVVAGLRFDSIDFDRYDLPIGGNPDAAFSTRFSEATWRLGIVYQPTDVMSVYAQASTAADPVTSPVTISSRNQNFDLSIGRQFEVGLKHQFWSDRGEYTVAWFDIEKQDLLTRRPASAITEQIGQQGSNGFEATLRLQPTRSLGIDANAAWINAEFDRFFSGNVSLAGNTPRNVPERTANLWLTWSPIRSVHVSGGVRYVARRYGDNANTQRLPSYSVFDGNVTWNASQHISLRLRARNLTDEGDYVLSQYTPDQWVFADPRSYELTLRLNF